MYKALLWLCLGLSGAEVLAQGTFEALRTGESGPFTIHREGVIVNSQNPDLRFQVAFATEEEIVPGKFLDSVTASFQATDDPAATLVLFTLDRTGANWGPSSPGAILLDPNAIGRTEIAFPSLQPQLPHSVAYEVTVSIPASLQGRALDFYFDLFDNQDSLRSLGAIGTFVAVPEPACVSLSVCGIAVGWLLRRRKP